MRCLLTLITFFSFLSSCSLVLPARQSIYQFRKYEQLEQLSQDTLFVLINTEKEDIALLEKYGRSKQARRLKTGLNRRNENYKAAFLQHFALAPVIFWELSEHDHQLPDGFYADIVLYEIPSGDDGMRTMMALQLKNNEDTILHSVNRDLDPYMNDLNSIVKQFSKELTRINKKGLGLKQDVTE